MSAFGRAAVCLAALAIASAGLPARAGDRKTVAAGTWGGQGIRMEVSDAGATIEYDCAHGTVDEPLVLDAGNAFGVRGLHYRESHGPAREGKEPRGEPVRYQGRVEGDSMTLTILPAGRDEPVGSFTLVRGKPGRIRKCG